MKENIWYADRKNKDMLTKDDAKFIFEQAEKQLKETLDASQSLVARTTTLITLLAGVMVALIAFSVKQLENKVEFSPILTTALISVIYLLIQSYILALNIKGIDYHVLGIEPKKIFVNEFFVESIEKNSRIIRFYVSEIEAYQLKIDVNKAINKKRWKTFNRGLMRVVYTPLILIIFYSLVKVIYYYLF
jgi:hypothetical protein